MGPGSSGDLAPGKPGFIPCPGPGGGCVCAALGLHKDSPSLAAQHKRTMDLSPWERTIKEDLVNREVYGIGVKIERYENARKSLRKLMTART